MNTYQLWKRAEQAKNDLWGQRWQSFSENPERIMEAYVSLPDEHRASYDVIFERSAALPFALDTLRKWHGPTATGAMLRAACGPLMKLGLLASVRTSWGERMLFIPEDVYECLLAFHLDRVSEECNSAPTGIEVDHNLPSRLLPLLGHGVVSVEAAKGLPADLFHLLVYTLNHGLPLTAKGVLHKKTITQLESILGLDEQALAIFDVRRPFAESMPLRVAIVLDMALRLGLLHKEATSYTVRFGRMKWWLKLPLNQGIRVIAGIVIEHYLPREALMWHLAHAVLYWARVSKWRTDETIMVACQYLGWQKDEVHTYEAVREQIRGWLRAAHALGLYDVGIAESRWFFRGRHQGNASDFQVLFVQPDFEIMVPPYAPPLVRFELEVFARLWSSDQMDIYHLTRESFENALEHGRSVQSVLGFLEVCSLTGVPDHVRDALEMWGRQYGRVQFSEVILLRCADMEIVKVLQVAMESSEQLKTWLTPIGSQDYIVNREHVKEVETLLTRYELPPLQRWGVKEKIRMPQLWLECYEEQAEEGEQEGPVYSPSSLQYYEMDTGLMEQVADTTDYDDISSQWTKALRPYHSSTKRDMVLTAIRHQTQLEVEEGGHSSVIVPLSSSVSDDKSWTISAYVLPCQTRSRPVQLSPENWEKVRLIVPEGLL